jgi:hypothetical protein
VRRAADHQCVFLGRTAEHLHHNAGRDAHGEYIYPRLFMPLVRSQHGVLHKLWNESGIGKDSNRDPLALAHYRIGQDLDSLGRYHQEGIVKVPDFYVVELGKVHRHVAEHIEAME